MQREQPAIGFFIIVNLPLWGWKGQPSYVGNEFLGDYHLLELNRASLALLDLYQQRGGRPNRYIVQSWYAHPPLTKCYPKPIPTRSPASFAPS